MDVPPGPDGDEPDSLGPAPPVPDDAPGGGQADSPEGVTGAPDGPPAGDATGPGPEVDPRLVDELAKLANPKKSWTRNLWMLVLSVALFYGFGYFRDPLPDTLILIAAIFVHEMGHFIGMKILGYRNVRMFFIPLFGAAVSGRSLQAPAWKRAVVTLLGPLPGIALAFVFFVL
jgi:hypothetical protein